MSEDDKFYWLEANRRSKRVYVDTVSRHNFYGAARVYSTRGFSCYAAVLCMPCASLYGRTIKQKKIKSPCGASM